MMAQLNKCKDLANMCWPGLHSLFGQYKDRHSVACWQPSVSVRMRSLMNDWSASALPLPKGPVVNSNSSPQYRTGCEETQHLKITLRTLPRFCLTSTKRTNMGASHGHWKILLSWLWKTQDGKLTGKALQQMLL